MKSAVRESAPVGSNTTSLCLDDIRSTTNSVLDHLTAVRALRNRCAPHNQSRTVIAPECAAKG